jgi:hypothetical protein
VTLKPLVDPRGFHPNRSTTADAHVPELAALDRCVDGIAADARMFGASATFSQSFIANSPRQEDPASAKLGPTDASR